MWELLFIFIYNLQFTLLVLINTLFNLHTSFSINISSTKLKSIYIYPAKGMQDKCT